MIYLTLREDAFPEPLSPERRAGLVAYLQRCEAQLNTAWDATLAEALTTLATVQRLSEDDEDD